MTRKPVGPTQDFTEVLGIIRGGRARAFDAVNLALMDTYWAVGGYLCGKVAQAGWGKGVVQELAAWLQARAPEVKGFSAQNLWRMKQFHEAFSADPKLSPLARVLPAQAAGVFKDSYLLDFLDLPQRHAEADLQSSLLRNLRQFLMELGDGFAYVGEKVRVQVGTQDFELDLLFYHRDRKRPHENPSIGVLLCRSKDDEVVEYAMSRHLSPALVARYETTMVPKAVLQLKLQEWSQMLQAPDLPAEGEA